MEKMAWGWITTLRGAVEGAAPTAAGPRGRARWRKESGFAMLGGEVVNASIRLSVEAAPGLPRLYNRGKGWVKLRERRSYVERRGLEPKFPVRRAKFRASWLIRLDPKISTSLEKK